jgi:hypothetical protein
MALNTGEGYANAPGGTGYKTVGAIGGYHAATLTGALTLDDTYPNVLALDPGGANRDVTLDNPPSDLPLLRTIYNKADAAENLVVKDSTPATIATLNQNEGGVFAWSGTAWSLVAIHTIAIS